MPCSVLRSSDSGSNYVSGCAFHNLLFQEMIAIASIDVGFVAVIAAAPTPCDHVVM